MPTWAPTQSSFRQDWCSRFRTRWALRRSATAVGILCLGLRSDRPSEQHSGCWEANAPTTIASSPSGTRILRLERLFRCMRATKGRVEPLGHTSRRLSRVNPSPIGVAYLWRWTYSGGRIDASRPRSFEVSRTMTSRQHQRWTRVSQSRDFYPCALGHRLPCLAIPRPFRLNVPN